MREGTVDELSYGARGWTHPVESGPVRVVAEYRHGIHSAPLIGRIVPEPLEVVDDRPITRLALRFRFPPASKAEPALDLVTVIAAAPQKQRIIIMGRTEIEDGPSLGDLSVYSIHDDQPGPRRHLLLESTQHAEVGRVTCLLVGSGISREPFRYPDPFGETDSQLSIDIAASDQDTPGGGVKAFRRRCLARCGEPTHDHDEAGMHRTQTGVAGR
jgi:hypothetical protein